LLWLLNRQWLVPTIKVSISKHQPGRSIKWSSGASITALNNLTVSGPISNRSSHPGIAALYAVFLASLAQKHRQWWYQQAITRLTLFVFCFCTRLGQVPACQLPAMNRRWCRLALWQGINHTAAVVKVVHFINEGALSIKFCQPDTEPRNGGEDLAASFNTFQRFAIRRPSR